MSVDKKIADARLLQHFVQALIVCTFRQPKAARAATKCLDMMLDAGKDLSTHRRGIHPQQRQESVCSRRSNDLQFP